MFTGLWNCVGDLVLYPGSKCLLCRRVKVKTMLDHGLVLQVFNKNLKGR